MKIGDEVKVIKQRQAGFKVGTVGKIDTISEQSDRIVRIKVNESYGWHMVDELELINKPE